jgi:hypothetical protein
MGVFSGWYNPVNIKKADTYTHDLPHLFPGQFASALQDVLHKVVAYVLLLCLTFIFFATDGKLFRLY